MLNFNTQFILMQESGLILLAVIFLFMVVQKNLKDFKRKLYMWVLWVSIICLVLDILSIAAVMQAGKLPVIVIQIIGKVYISMLVWSGWTSYTYMINAAVSQKKYTILVGSTATGNLVANAVFCMLPMYYYHDSTSCYLYGPAVYAVYAVCIAYFLLIFISCYAHKKKLNIRYRFAMVFWDVTVLISGLAQLFFREVRLLGFGLALGALILFIVQENPLSNIDRTLGCFNSYAFHSYIDYLFKYRKIFSAERIYLDGDIKRHGGSYPTSTEIKALCEKLVNLENIFIFKDNDYALLAIAKDASSLDNLNQNVLLPLIESNNKIEPEDIVRIDYFDDINNSNELMRLLDFIHESRNAEKDKIIAINSADIKKYKDSIRLAQEIDEALEEDRVEVFFQPIFDYETNKFSAAEALCRIRNRDGSLMPPGQFIPVAEKSNQIIRLGERVIDKSCTMIKERNITDFGIKYIEINLSVVQCEDENFADKISKIVEKHDLNPSLINWEITETASISSRERLLENMQSLVDKGFKFSLDDFGKGESNLMYIVDMPVSIVKLDMDMTKAFFSSTKAKEVLRTVVRMVHRLGLKIVCEGVEDEVEAETLYYENVDYIQGYYYSRPLPENEFVETVKEVRSAKF